MPATLVGVDLDPAAIAAAQAHQRASRRPGRRGWLSRAVRIVTNPPWGTLHGEHATNQQLLAKLLDRAAALSAPGARLGVLTHEIRRMHEVLAQPGCPWTAGEEHRFFQKGHHPRLFLLSQSPRRPSRSAVSPA